MKRVRPTSRKRPSSFTYIGYIGDSPEEAVDFVELHGDGPIVGRFGIFLDGEPASPTYNLYGICHLPTGLTVFYAYSEEDAKRIAEYIDGMEVPVDWENDDIDLLQDNREVFTKAMNELERIKVPYQG